MKQYTDKALETIQEHTARLYAKLASTKPDDDFTRDDIRECMYYIKAFQDEARTEQTRRKVASLKVRN